MPLLPLLLSNLCYHCLLAKTESWCSMKLSFYVQTWRFNAHASSSEFACGFLFQAGGDREPLLCWPVLDRWHFWSSVLTALPVWHQHPQHGFGWWVYGARAIRRWCVHTRSVCPHSHRPALYTALPQLHWPREKLTRACFFGSFFAKLCCLLCQKNLVVSNWTFFLLLSSGKKITQRRYKTATL